MIPAYEPDRCCPKCLAEMPEARWHARAEVMWPCAEPDAAGQPAMGGEHLCRRCVRCEYRWIEIPADGGAPVPEPLNGTEIRVMYEAWKEDAGAAAAVPATGVTEEAAFWLFRSGAEAASQYWQQRLGL